MMGAVSIALADAIEQKRREVKEKQDKLARQQETKGKPAVLDPGMAPALPIPPIAGASQSTPTNVPSSPANLTASAAADALSGKSLGRSVQTASSLYNDGGGKSPPSGKKWDIVYAKLITNEKLDKVILLDSVFQQDVKDEVEKRRKNLLRTDMAARQLRSPRKRQESDIEKEVVTEFLPKYRSRCAFVGARQQSTQIGTAAIKQEEFPDEVVELKEKSPAPRSGCC